jgi:type I restriction enzyme M protein
LTDSEQLAQLEGRLWGAADELRANSNLRASEYSLPVLGLIFLRHADVRFNQTSAELTASGTGRRKIGKADYQARGVLYLPEAARYAHLRQLPEGTNYGKALNDAMKAIEEANDELKGVLPNDYARLENSTLIELLRLIGSIPDDIEGDAFGRIYEYFLGKFAMSEGQRGGEFFTPTSIVKLIVEIIEPFHGRIFDPACGSGGMFVQSARFVENHQKDPSHEISVYGQERVAETIRLCKMNLAVHGLSGDIKQANTYYEDLHDSVGRFDFVMANPPFNVNAVDKERIREDPRYSLGIPNVDNGNYLWIQNFANTLSEKGRAGFVMANSASDARHSELAIRRTLIEAGQVDVMVAVSSNFFYTVTLPVTLWFLDKGKKATDRADQVLFIDARHTFRQVSRALRDFTPEQHEFLANIARMYRREEPEFLNGSDALVKEHFPELEYVDVSGLCKVTTIEEIAAQGWSLNPGRYVGVGGGGDADLNFTERFGELTEEFQSLSIEAASLQDVVLTDAAQLLSHALSEAERVPEGDA